MLPRSFGFLPACLLLLVSCNVGSAQAQLQFAPATEVIVPNPSQNESSPSLSSDNLTLYFHSDARVPSLGGFELWTATRATPTASFSPAVSLGAPVNTSDAEGNPKISRDGLSLYFTSNRPGGNGDLDGWVASRSSPGASFGVPVNLTTLNSTSSDGGPDVSADGLIAVFSSNRPGGSGERDIYIATRAATSVPFGSVTNLGPTVNTGANERSPSLSADGLHVFFGSDRPGGFGDYDLWMSSRASLTAPWGTPVNLGPNVNSSATDEIPDFSWDGSTIVFDSFRSGSYRLYQAAVVPEPSALALLAGGLILASFAAIPRLRRR
jgi:Tol biopolymer transport system component